MTEKDKRRNALDPAIKSVLGEDPLYGRMAKERNMTASQRKRAKADRERNRVMIDLPEDLQEVVDRIAEAEGLPRSQVVSWLLAIGLQHFDQGEMIDARVPSRSMRWEFTLDIPEIEFPEGYSAGAI